MSGQGILRFAGLGAALAVLLSCAATAAAGGYGGQRQSEVFGFAGCRSADVVDCDGLSGKTHRERNPDRIEYMRPDGRLFLWTGDKIVKGRWNISHGLLTTDVCYRYDGSSPPSCANLRAEVRRRDGTILGDPFELATRSTPPFRLMAMDRRDLNQMLADIAAQKAGRRKSTRNPEG